MENEEIERDWRSFAKDPIVIRHYISLGIIVTAILYVGLLSPYIETLDKPYRGLIASIGGIGALLGFMFVLMASTEIPRVLERHYIPSIGERWCHVDYKRRPIWIFNIIEWIGIGVIVFMLLDFKI